MKIPPTIAPAGSGVDRFAWWIAATGCTELGVWGSGILTFVTRLGTVLDVVGPLLALSERELTTPTPLG
jgi:hypothetical protein